METNEKLLKRLKSWKGKRIVVNFPSRGIIGDGSSGILKDFYDNYLELQYYDDDPEDIELVNLNKVTSIELEK